MQQDQQNQPQPPPPAAAAPQGGTNPRMNGAVMLGIGIVMMAFNVWTLMDDATFYPKLVILGAAITPLGGWTLVTGISYDKNATVKPPAWWTAGAVILTILGLIAGIAFTVMISV
jgi:hypothetical protein